MSIHIGEMITEAAVEPDTERSTREDTGSRPGAAMDRDALPAPVRDRARTAAEGYDD